MEAEERDRKPDDIGPPHNYNVLPTDIDSDVVQELDATERLSPPARGLRKGPC
jgi:hypothetical protein